MVFQVLSGLPRLFEEQDVRILHIHIAIAAYAAVLAPDRAKHRFYGLKDFLPFFNRHCHLKRSFDQSRSPGDGDQLLFFKPMVLYHFFIPGAFFS
jgi:hypothetical protein